MEARIYRLAVHAEGDEPPTDGSNPGPVRTVDSTALFQRDREVVIVHRGQQYRLRITKSDKLILTK